MDTPEPTNTPDHQINMPAYPTLNELSRRPPIDIEFQDLTYTVPQGRTGKILVPLIL